MDAFVEHEDAEFESVSANLTAGLPEDVGILIHAAGTVASKKGYSLYVVGGFVRDLLLGKPNLDIDLVVVGNAIALAYAMEKRFGGRVEAHQRFGTAKWLLDGSPFTSLTSLDFVSARREVYANPGSLPQVEPGAIREDLARRDFTINALAICLDDGRFGQLLNYFGGLADLRGGSIRVLHDQSFVDDPTRILRAVRYEQRLGFTIEPRTLEQARGAVTLLARVSGERIANELFLTFAEQFPETALLSLGSLGALRAIHPALEHTGLAAQRFARLREQAGQPSALDYLGALNFDLSAADADAVAARLSLSKAETEFLVQVSRLRSAQEALRSTDLPSQVVALLEPFAEPALRVAELLAESLDVQQKIARFRAEWRAVRPLTGGDRLRELGISAGPIYKQILRALRAGRLDGSIASQAEEERVALDMAESSRTRATSGRKR
jgi:tRNA nucleotidyltransferase (CCA-adding enzyme)